MKLKTKLLLLSVFPVIALGLGMILLSTARISDAVYQRTYIGMRATTLAVRDIFEIGNEGEYYIDEQGNLWKGDTLNVSQATNIVDEIKGNTGMDVTVFWGDTRILTSIVDESGKRQVNTQASEDVIQKVLREGQTYQKKNVEILGKEYVVCYIPFYQEGTKDVVGMVFLGTPQETVTSIISRAQLHMIVIALAVMLVMALIVFLLVDKMSSALRRGVTLLDEMSEGNLNIEVDAHLMQRRDEIGEIGKAIHNMKEKLYGIIQVIRENSEDLEEQSQHLSKVSGEVHNIMMEVEHSAHTMSASCSEQAQDSDKASRNVSHMGDMIEDSGGEIQRLNEISQKIKAVSEQALEQFHELNEIMENVKGSIFFLSEQTGLTNESVAKISTATELITAIASQTNLLSLNASIEAARAGEHGRGFAVVASEIQQLSEQSNQAAEEIKNMIASLNTNSGHAMERMQNVKTVVEKQEQDIRKTSEIFQSVSEGIDESVAGMNNILSKSKELENVRSDTVAIVQNSAALSEENAASIQQIMSSIETINAQIGGLDDKTTLLTELSEEMRKSVNVFSA